MNPGPGHYHRKSSKDEKSKRLTYPSTFRGQAGRVDRHSIFDSTTKLYPAPNHYNVNNNLTDATQHLASPRSKCYGSGYTRTNTPFAEDRNSMKSRNFKSSKSECGTKFSR